MNSRQFSVSGLLKGLPPAQMALAALKIAGAPIQSTVE